MTRITIGQYYPADSVIHRLDPRIKLGGVLIYIMSLFFVNSFWGYGIAAIFLGLIIWLSKVPPLMILRGLRAVLFVLSFAILINLFMTPGQQVLFQFGFIRITAEGLQMAGEMAARLILLIAGSSILTLTSSPIQLTDGIEALLRPLNVIKVPAHDIAIMMTITLRFIPILADEVGKIMNAQKARGADLDTGGFIKRAKSLIPILVPLFVSAFKRADELATAMEARCYRGDVGRTRMKEMRVTRVDLIAAGIMIVYAMILFSTRFM